MYERRKLEGEAVKITLVFVGLLLGSWCMAQEPWRPLLFFLAIMGLLLGFWRVAQEPWRLCALSPMSEQATFFTKTMNQDH